MPYPPPVASLPEPRSSEDDAARRRALFHRIWPTELPRAGQSVLIAGCGTTQAARHALRDPEAHVTAIDVSEASLRHTAQLQRRHRLDNLDIRRLAIEDVDAL